MALYPFGSGFAFGIRTDIANPSPVAMGVLQDVTIKTSGDLKSLFGTNQYALAFGRGKGKIEITAKFAQYSGAVFNSLYWNQTLTVGQKAPAIMEAAMVPATTTYTVTAANAASFIADWGVFYASTGAALTKVATGPTIGQYTVSNVGVYTFAAADASAAVLLNYSYSISTSGSTITVTNPTMGTVPITSLWFPQTVNGRSIVYKFNNCVSNDLTFATKQDDFTISEMTFMAGADASGNVMYISAAE